MTQRIPVDNDFYNQMMQLYNDYIDTTANLYRLNARDEDEIYRIYKKVKACLIDSNNMSPHTLINKICSIYCVNNRYLRSYLRILKKIFDEYNINPFDVLDDVSLYLYCTEFGISIPNSEVYQYLEENVSLNIHDENTIYKAIMDDDKDSFIVFIEQEQFDKDQKLETLLYPDEINSLIELCCYHGSVQCFKILRAKFQSPITIKCLCCSFLSGNQEIMNECMKYVEPNHYCMNYALYTHNIDFIVYLMNEYNLEIKLKYCGFCLNLKAFFVYANECNDLNKCFAYCPLFHIKSLIEYFLSRGVDINSRDEKNGKTALHYSSRYNVKENIEFLISHGADIHLKDSKGRIALYDAVKSSNKDVVEYLIAQGSDVNEEDVYGFSPLHIAVQKKRKDNVEVLISHGANINAIDKNKKTALHYAVELESTEITEILLKNGIECQDALQIAAANNCVPMLKFIIEQTPNINSTDYKGKTALHYAAENGCQQSAECLISHFIDIKSIDRKGRTALHLAAINNYTRIAYLLLSRGININDKDYKGRTALHLAVINYNIEMVEFLLSCGIHTNAVNFKGKTALNIAEESNYTNIIQILKSHGAISYEFESDSSYSYSEYE